VSHRALLDPNGRSRWEQVPARPRGAAIRQAASAVLLLSLFWGWRVDYNSIFCDVRGEHDPANGCLVTGPVPDRRYVRWKNLGDGCDLWPPRASAKKSRGSPIPSWQIPTMEVAALWQNKAARVSKRLFGSITNRSLTVAALW